MFLQLPALSRSLHSLRHSRLHNPSRLSHALRSPPLPLSPLQRIRILSLPLVRPLRTLLFAQTHQTRTIYLTKFLPRNQQLCQNLLISLFSLKIPRYLIISSSNSININNIAGLVPISSTATRSWSLTSSHLNILNHRARTIRSTKTLTVSSRLLLRHSHRLHSSMCKTPRDSTLSRLVSSP